MNNGGTSRLLSTLLLHPSAYDSNRLFPLTEFHDRARFYRAIQDLRESSMDLTS